MDQGKFERRKAVAAKFRSFIAKLLTQFKRPPEERLEKAVEMAKREERS